MRYNKPKWLIGLRQKAPGAGGRCPTCLLVAYTLPGRQPAPTPRALLIGKRGNPVSLLTESGQRAVRCAYGGAGLGCRKKRRPCCNGTDTGFNVTRPERGPTSDGSFIARDVGESLAGGKANDNRGVPTAWCIRPGSALGRAGWASYRKARTTTATAYCEGRPEGSGTGSGNGLLKGLSGVRGNFHAPFLEGRVGW